MSLAKRFLSVRLRIDWPTEDRHSDVGTQLAHKSGAKAGRYFAVRAGAGCAERPIFIAVKEQRKAPSIRRKIETWFGMAG
jgi:hypothetical protein